MNNAWWLIYLNYQHYSKIMKGYRVEISSKLILMNPKSFNPTGMIYRTTAPRQQFKEVGLS